MGVNANAMIVPGNGTIFHAPIGTPLPANPLTAFTLTGTPPTDWVNLGHTSRENTVAFSREGGEPTSMGTWLADSTSTIYSAIAWSLSIPALQFDQDVLDFAFNGEFNTETGGYIVPGQTAAVRTQLYLLMQDNSGKLGFWIPNTEVTLGEPPSVNREQYLELPLTASINAAENSVIPAVDGRPGIMELFKSGLVAPAPAWAATTAYALGDRVEVGSATLSCTTAGTSGSTAPTPPAIGQTVTDGTAVWTRQA